MKIINSAFLFLLLSFTVRGQLPYILTTSSQPFQYLTSPTLLSGASQTVSLPFSFYMLAGGLSTATVNTSNDGYINFGSEGIVSFSGSMNYKNSSTATGYEVSGTAPSRIFKFEWKNQGLSYSAATNDSITYQIWLYETSNVIEWHFGPNYWYNGSFNNYPLVLLINGSSAYTIWGNPASPTFNACGFTCHLQGIPVPGKVYILTPTANSVNVLNQSRGMTLFPNPTDGASEIYFESAAKEKTVFVSDITGRIIKTINVSAGETKAHLKVEAKGMYFVTVIEDGARSTQKLVIE